jgi:hypothetical protein
MRSVVTVELLLVVAVQALSRVSKSYSNSSIERHRYEDRKLAIGSGFVKSSFQ